MISYEFLTEAHVAPGAVTNVFSVLHLLRKVVTLQIDLTVLLNFKKIHISVSYTDIFIYLFLETHVHPGRAQKIQASSCIIHNNLK